MLFRLACLGGRAVLVEKALEVCFCRLDLHVIFEASVRPYLEVIEPVVALAQRVGVWDSILIACCGVERDGNACDIKLPTAEQHASIPGQEAVTHRAGRVLPTSAHHYCHASAEDKNKQFYDEPYFGYGWFYIPMAFNS